MDVELPNGVVIQGIPEGTSKEAVIQKAIAGGYMDAPPPKMSSMDKFLSGVLGAVEPGITLATGTAALAPAGISEAINPGSYDHVLDAYTYEPRTEAGKAGLENFTQNIAQPVSEFTDKFRPAEAVYDATGSETLGAIAGAIPEMVMAAVGARTMPGKPAPPTPGTLSSSPAPFRFNDPIVQDIKSGKPIARTAKYDLTSKGLKGNKLAKKAIGQGWDESFISWVKTADKTTRQNLKEMVSIVKKRVGELKDFSSNARPSDVLGKSLKSRLDRVKQVQRQAGGLIKRVSKQQLSGKQVDISAALEAFKAKVFELGGKVNKKGELEFGIDSQLYGQASKQKAFKDVFAKINKLGDVTDGYKAHQLKQFVTEYVDFGKGSKEGISANVETVLKGLRANINETLKGQSAAYDRVNTAYSGTTQALSDFQKAAGRSIDLFGPESDAAMGRVLRKLLSNMQNRENLSAAMKQVEKMAKEYGGKYVDDLTAQAKAVNEIERLMGSFAETSFKGEITSGVQRIAESPSVRQLGTEAVRLSAKQLQKTRQNQTKQIRALEELLASP